MTQTPASTPYRDPKAVASALRLFRIMAIIAGIALVVLILAMILKYGMGRPGFSNAWAPIHGLLYFMYFLSIFNLGTKAQWSIVRMGLVALTGFVPVLPWIAERRIGAEVNARLAAG